MDKHKYTECIEEAYKQGVLERKGSDGVNQAILELLETFGDPECPLERKEFEKKWQEFVKATIEDFPNISVYNLTASEPGLSARRLNGEVLFVRRLVAEILPDSDESQCFLGHAYRNVGKFELAAKRYQRAFDLVEKRLEERQDYSSGGWLDAADYLCYLAETEIELTCYQDAVVNITKAWRILDNSPQNTEWKKVRMNMILGETFEKQDRGELAVYYYEQALQVLQADKHGFIGWYKPDEIEEKLRRIK